MENHSALPLSDALGELAALLLAADTVDDLTEQVAQLATRFIPAAVTCGITVSAAGRVLTVASADGLGRLLDEQQYDIDEGPCLEAIRTKQVVTAPDLATEDRWQPYPTRALAHGIAFVHSTPMLVLDECIGALNMYADTRNAFAAADVEATRALAALASAGAAGALRYADEATLTDHLRTALRSREVIDQAIGIVVAREHCPPQQAFAILRTISQTRNVRLNEVAAELVQSTIRDA